MFYTLKELSPHTPLTKGGKGGFAEVPLNKGEIGGFDKATLKLRGMITTGFHLPYNPNLKETARLLRKNMTPAEKKIWYGYLKTFEYPVLRQRPIDNYVVDFYCPKYKLIIEIDGDNHFAEDGKIYDQERTATLEQYGLKVIRFQNHDVMKNMESVVKKIEEIIDVLATNKKNADGN